jgi:hypothetical protein
MLAPIVGQEGKSLYVKCKILDPLRDGPRQTTEIVAEFPQLSRFGVMKPPS